MDFLIRSQTARLRTLISDLESLEAGEVSASALMGSPYLDNWRQVFRRSSCLEGVVMGHPSLPDGHVISTGEIWAQFHDDDGHFVRTLNRWYRLVERGKTPDGSTDGLPSFEGARE
ncbi:hypothetical protein [Neorhizobium sp. DAR64861/K0K2]|uniref:hypothetical protein n=1 Tax=unclassified Neorhizobium TaxID=2629175 RepID=UPI003D2A0872